MSVLVGYGSSDEDDDEVGGQSATGLPPEAAGQSETTGLAVPSTSAHTNGPSASRTPTSDNEPSTTATPLGPVGPPQMAMANPSAESAPSSPYTSHRTTIRNLTLPTKPNLDIPPSPPGSPTDAEQKFAHFLELKRQGVHFNAKLASSSALKNPSLLPKLMISAGVDESKQYASTLPSELWNPLGFPKWAYKEELGKSQQDVMSQKEEDRGQRQRENIDFVSAGIPTQSNRGGTPGVSTKGIRGSAAERVMAGLDREKKSSPQLRKRD